MKKFKALLIASSLCACISPAHAQFGAKLPGLGGSSSNSSVSAGDIDGFLARSQEATVMIGVASVLLKDAADGRIDRAGSSATIKAIRGTTSSKEMASTLSFMKSDVQADQLNGANAAALEQNLASASAEDRAVIGAALVNIALGIPRAIKLAQEVPNLIKGLGSSPSSLGQVGKLKDAGALLALQVKYTADILPILPRLMSAAKVKLPANAETSKPVSLGSDFE